MDADVARKRDPAVVRGFRHRGHHNVLRIESFSDAVFGFSITLLVVSLQVPKTFDDLLETLSAFPSFALTFALLAEIWFLQYRFFRRYGLQDSTTIFLNIVLLFVIVFFTYPLKFLFGSGRSIRDDQWAPLYAVYGLGFAAVFGIFFLLHAHALRKSGELELTPLEIFETRLSMVLSSFQIFVAAISVATAEFFTRRGAYDAAASLGGFAYILIPIGLTIVAAFARKRRRALRRAQETAEADRLR